MNRKGEQHAGGGERPVGKPGETPVTKVSHITRDPSSAVLRHRERSTEMKLLRVVLWIVWLAICAVLWVLLLDTSYDWISSTSNIKVVFGFVILASMVGVVVAVAIKGARVLWTR